MIVTRRIALRLAVIGILGVVLQVSFFSEIGLLGSAPDVIPVIVVSLGLLGGAVVGAVSGFAIGFLLDSVLLQTLGVSSLVLLTIGYLAGRYREGAEITDRWMPALLTGGLTLVGASMFTAIQLMLGVDTPVSLLVVREIVVQSLFATLLALGVYPLLRRVLAPALIDHQPARRRLRLPRLRRRRSRRTASRPGVGAGIGGDAATHRGGRRRRGEHPRRPGVTGGIR
ncbi:MAG: rod shape-determining protein MreD [Solirubrobacterales bacterium]